MKPRIYLSHLIGHMDDDDAMFRTEDIIEYTCPDSGDTLEVPKGFETDLESVPSILQFIIPRAGHGIRASIVHDWIIHKYDHSITKYANRAMKIAMIEDGIPEWRCTLMYIGVEIRRRFL